MTAAMDPETAAIEKLAMFPRAAQRRSGRESIFREALTDPLVAAERNGGDPALAVEDLPPIFDPGSPLNSDLAKLLRSDAIASLSVAHRGLLLLRNDEDEATHRVVQADEGQIDADAVHAIMHRREGDFGNARYWARIVDQHSIYDRLAEVVVGYAGTEPVRQTGRWRPMQLVDFCSRLDQLDDLAVTAARIAAELEMRLLRDHLLAASF